MWHAVPVISTLLFIKMLNNIGLIFIRFYQGLVLGWMGATTFNYYLLFSGQKCNQFTTVLQIKPTDSLLPLGHNVGMQ